MVNRQRHCWRALGVLALLVLLAPADARAATPGDVDCTGLVDLADWAALPVIVFEGPPAGTCANADVNLDGRVGSADLAALATILQAPPPVGPMITYVGLASANGSLIAPLGKRNGVPVFYRTSGSGFKLIVEAMAGNNGAFPGSNTVILSANEPADRADLEIEATSALGDGSPTVCDGGVPAIAPPDFALTQAITNAVNDFACSFGAATAPSYGCTVDALLNPAFFGPVFFGLDTQLQFCATVARSAAFPRGETLVSARVRDVNGNPGPVKQFVIEIGDAPIPGTFTPTATPTSTRPIASPTPNPTRTTTTGSTPTRNPTSPRSATPTASGLPGPATATVTGTTTASPTPTATSALGPVVSYLGITRADDTLVPPSDTASDGAPIYVRAAGTGFSVVVEGGPGLSKRPVGCSAYRLGQSPTCQTVSGETFPLPDLQVEVSRPLGNGSPAVCDNGATNPGGVPAVDPPDFAPVAPAIDATNDLGCRFVDGRGLPQGRLSNESCVMVGDAGEYRFASDASSIQFCAQITGTLEFPSGDTVVTAQLLDVDGNAGPPAHMIIRIGVVSPSPTDVPSATPTASATMTASAIPSATRSPTRSPTRTTTATSGASTPTRSPTAGATPTRTPTLHATPTPSATTARSSTSVPSSTRTRTATPVPTATRTATLTRTPTRTVTRTPTVPPAAGPLVTFFGLARADDTLMSPSGTTPEGVPYYSRPAGSSFKIVVEARPGLNAVPVGGSAYREDGLAFPDLQIQPSQPLGNGSEAVCDDGTGNPPQAGGIPGTDPADFTLTAENIAHVNDFGCRFIDGSGNPVGRPPSDSCVQVGGGDLRFVDATSTIQFCATKTSLIEFPEGDTWLTVRLADENGVVGPISRMIVRMMVPTATPTPTVPAPTQTPTRPQPLGPVITFLGLTAADNTVQAPIGTDDAGIPIYQRPIGFGFFIAIEAMAGLNRISPGVRFGSQSPDGRPDVQVLVSRDLGDGSTLVCDTGPAPALPLGGIPGVDPPDFDAPDQAVTDALNDFGCRLANNTSFPCTASTGGYDFVKSNSTNQFCTAGVVGNELRFPVGDTVLSVRWRDGFGVPGPPAQIIVRADS